MKKVIEVIKENKIPFIAILVIVMVITGVVIHGFKKDDINSFDDIRTEYTDSLTGSDSALGRAGDNNQELGDQIERATESIGVIETYINSATEKLGGIEARTDIIRNGSQQLEEGLSGATETTRGIFNNNRRAREIIERLRNGDN